MPKHVSGDPESEFGFPEIVDNERIRLSDRLSV